ncbi:MAG: cysteine--tRNA ligase [Ruminococcaceae bacterium]|nr:cysteine--tRNA ligase [Oscillospiraceae bacterium]
MYLYNTATHKREEFVPNEPGKVSIYTCGPTVYHYAHIGNLRTYIMEDILDRYMRYVGYNVTRVMNITDVGHLSSDGDTGEDKMLKGAKREKKTVMEIAKYYTDCFFADCEKLNIRRPDIIDPATACVDDFIRVIEALIEKGFAYEAGGNIYFDTSKLSQYYIFNDFTSEDLAVGVREGVEEDSNKRNKADFVLWFTKSKFEDQELKWDSPWGIGYPGWHIECSCIAMKHLGERLDIHCGGIDNAFPHHTNEIAQSEAYLGHKWCNYWMHVLHLNTDSGKMSKSKGEFLTVSLLESKGYDPLAYRFFCLGSHYRRSLVFSFENLDNAVVSYNKLIARIAALKVVEGEEIDQDALDALKAKFREALDNDLNTSLAITALYNVLKSTANTATKRAAIKDFDTVLALNLLDAADALAKQKAEEAAKAAVRTYSDDPEIRAIEEAIDARAAAKKAKNYAEADRIRQELLEKGIVLTDTSSGTTWAKKA